MNTKLDIVRFECEDVISTSGLYCASLYSDWGVLSQKAHKATNPTKIDYNGFTYTAETGDLIYDANGQLVSSLEVGKYYHFDYEQTSPLALRFIFVECDIESHHCDDPSHPGHDLD